jgi:hypothetical protein
MRTSSGINTHTPVRPDEAEFRQYQRTLEGAINHRLFKGGLEQYETDQRFKYPIPKANLLTTNQQLLSLSKNTQLSDDLLEKVAMKVRDIRLN